MTRSLTPLTQLLIERTGGNPFFLEESVRTLVETGVLVGEPGAYRLVQALPTIQVPATVHAVLAARIDRLPPEEKHLLQTAAVIGTEVPLPLLQAIAELPEAALHRGLAHLQAAEFLYETRLFPDHAYTFKHALTHEVAYGSLLQERRRGAARPHRRGPRTPLPRPPDRAGRAPGAPCPAGRGVGQGPGILPAGGGEGPGAVGLPRGCGYFEQALSALAHLPEQRDTLEQAIDLRLALRTALRPLGDFGRIQACLREAESLAEALDDHASAGTGLDLSVQPFLLHGRV